MSTAFPSDSARSPHCRTSASTSGRARCWDSLAPMAPASPRCSSAWRAYCLATAAWCAPAANRWDSASARRCCFTSRTASHRGRRSPSDGRSISPSGSSAAAGHCAMRLSTNSIFASLLRQPIGTLSKGQRKRVLLAIGLLTPQPALLIDEPFDGLDLRQARDVAAALRVARRPRADALPLDSSDRRRRALLRSLRAAQQRASVRRRHGGGTGSAGSPARRSAAVGYPRRGVSCAHLGLRSCGCWTRNGASWWCPGRGGCCCSPWDRWWVCRSSAPCRHLRRSERTERNRRRRRRSSIAADREFGRPRSAPANWRPSSCCRSSRFVWWQATGRAALSSWNSSRACRRLRASRRRRWFCWRAG